MNGPSRTSSLLAALLFAALLLASCSSGGGDFAEGMHRFTVHVDGPGTVSIEEFDWSCSDDCTLPVDDGVALTLEALPSGGAGFTGWGGACSGSSACTLEITGDTEVTAAFDAPSQPGGPSLALDFRGDGEGTVDIHPGGVCDDDCRHEYTTPVQVSLLARADSGSEIRGWTGPCEHVGTGSYCLISVTGPTSVSIDISRIRRELQLTVSGNGAVELEPGGQRCTEDCSHSYAHGETVELSASAGRGWRFARWEGCASADGSSCRVQMDSSRQVRAVFTPAVFLLQIQSNSGGSVAVSPQGQSCGGSRGACFEYEHGAEVTLAARSAPFWTFDRWEGACAGQPGSTCTLTMNEDRSVTARFRRPWSR